MDDFYKLCICHQEPGSFSVLKSSNAMSEWWLRDPTFSFGYHIIKCAKIWKLYINLVIHIFKWPMQDTIKSCMSEKNQESVVEQWRTGTELEHGMFADLALGSSLHLALKKPTKWVLLWQRVEFNNLMPLPNGNVLPGHEAGFSSVTQPTCISTDQLQKQYEAPADTALKTFSVLLFLLIFKLFSKC